MDYAAGTPAASILPTGLKASGPRAAAGPVIGWPSEAGLAGGCNGGCASYASTAPRWLACLRAGAGSISDLGCTRDAGCGCPVGVSSGTQICPLSGRGNGRSDGGFCHVSQTPAGNQPRVAAGTGPHHG